MCVEVSVGDCVCGVSVEVCVWEYEGVEFCVASGRARGERR